MATQQYEITHITNVDILIDVPLVKIERSDNSKLFAFTDWVIVNSSGPQIPMSDRRSWPRGPRLEKKTVREHFIACVDLASN